MPGHRALVRRGCLALLSGLILSIVLFGPPSRSKAQQRSNRDELRAKIAILRGDVGLMQVESEGARMHLLEILKSPGEDMEKVEGMGHQLFARADDGDFSKMFQDALGNADFEKSNVEALRKQFDEAVAKDDAATREKVLKEFLEATIAVDRKNYDNALDQLKKTYKDGLVQLADKELLLEDALKRYREAE